MKQSTQCVHVGGAVDKETGSIRRPIYMNNSYASTSFVVGQGEGGSPVFGYARDGHANQYYLERRLAAIEGGEDCVVVASGVAANNGTFLTLLSAGDHMICANPCYYSVFKFLKDHLAARLGIPVTFVNGTDLDEIKRAIRPNTKIIHIETPTNPITRIIDVAAVARIARAAGALLTVDSTWATPILLRPLELGADLVIHSLTKYINGHGDSLGGAVIGRKAIIDKLRVEGMVRLGYPISPFNAWLILRGMSTLPLRMKQHCSSAMKIAAFLEGHRGVEFVRYPGLKSHPQHKLAKRQMSGFSGMMNFRLKCSTAQHDKFVKLLKVITPAVSLGHDESLILHHPLVKNVDPWYEILKETTEDFGKGFLRFSVGLEDPDDLIEDLKQAIKKVV
ncbi:MAG: aminotransferase class I/II-fold pyridoxal phosphate-dependent enzyme [bacterium]